LEAYIAAKRNTQFTATMEDLDHLIDTVLTEDAQPEDLFNAVSSLAKLSREEETVRTRLASKDALQRLMKILLTRMRTLPEADLLAATLRCVGNACVSNPEACATVTEYKFDWYYTFLVPKKSDLRPGHKMPDHTPGGNRGWAHTWASPHWDAPPAEIRELTIKVLYNICSQSEEAQKLCYIGGVDIQVFTVLSEYDRSPVENPSLAIDLLFWITSHHKELSKDPGAKYTHMAHPNRVLFGGYWTRILEATSLLWDKVDVEDYATLVESMLVFLRDPEASNENQNDAQRMSRIWRVLTRIERKIQQASEDADDVKLLAALSTSLTWVLSDISASTAFASHVIANTGDHIRPFIEDLCQLLTTGVALSRPKMNWNLADADEIVDGDALRLTSAACQIVGNMLHGQTSSEKNLQPDDDRAGKVNSEQPLAVQDRHIYQRLFALMTTSDNADFLHSAAGFLIQLSRPSSEVRAEIAGDNNALAAIERLGQHPMQQLNQDALMLMRALGKDTPSVQEKLKELAGEVMATVAETQKAAAGAQAEQAAITSTA